MLNYWHSYDFYILLLISVLVLISFQLFIKFLITSLFADAKIGEKSNKNKAVMGFHLFNPHYFSFHTLKINNTRQQHQILTSIVRSNRLFFALFFTLILLPIYGVITVEPPLQIKQQTSQDINSFHIQCESKALDDVPPDPVCIHTVN